MAVLTSNSNLVQTNVHDLNSASGREPPEKVQFVNMLSTNNDSSQMQL